MCLCTPHGTIVTTTISWKESLCEFTKYKVDIVFIGHVHAYERSKRVSNVAYNIVNGECTPMFDLSSLVYITIGDGGNLEGLAANLTEPQPQYSAFHEASFGHAILENKKTRHMLTTTGIVIKMEILFLYFPE